ncbi:hypothetical protein BGW36DRAFT_363779 [Talaromyces proteolyticus]|uniref:Uncharacterized protein n=1 Tax=Talaromyces proteolyticus TaxID=1131652 RepID=A0AAD4PW28_9EURO|nr:uncharacterized protein BGW36DRAFT_363779 [Talaromyces proteolyticus]KAH8691447.1 hypothetical protein BGW36DRAFT_363779 [Talaromyces proteolyticus]
MTPKACDQCYRNKEKCSFTLAAEKRLGRRPNSKSFVHGSLHIWDYERGNQIETNNSRSSTRASNCISPSTSASCLDLALPREKKEDDEQDVPLARVLDQILQYHSTLQTTTDAMRIVTHDVQFAVIHIPFTMGRSFMNDLRNSVYSVLSQSAPTLTDGYIAFLVLVAHCQASRLYCTTPDLYRGARALRVLRNIKTVRHQDAVGILLLGQVLFVFEILTDTFTSSAHSIVRSALISARRWYPFLLQEPRFDTITICPIIMDTVCCLVYREVPVIRLCIQNRIIVDRFMGVSSTLMPLLYDLCVISHIAKSATAGITLNSPRTIDEEHPDDCYSDIEKSIEDWVPTLPPDFLSAYDKAEVQMMLTQANVYRLAGLLVIHRLRYPFGVRDSVAQHYANCIFSEMSSSCAALTQDGMRALPIMFPLWISMFEVEGPGEDLLEKFSCFPLPSVCMSKLCGFVKHVRMAKESGYNGLWFDLVENNLHFAVIP